MQAQKAQVSYFLGVKTTWGENGATTKVNPGCVNTKRERFGYSQMCVREAPNTWLYKSEFDIFKHHRKKST